MRPSGSEDAVASGAVTYSSPWRLRSGAELGPGRPADERRMQRRVAVVMEPRGAELRRLHPAARLRHLLEQAHATAGIQQVRGRDERVMAGADEHDVGLLWKIGHAGDR